MVLLELTVALCPEVDLMIRVVGGGREGVMATCSGLLKSHFVEFCELWDRRAVMANVV